jgi:hypothetical protein
MFDPLFLPMLVLGPIALAYLLRNELRRDEESFRPDGLSILLGIFAAFGLREWILLVASVAFDSTLDKLPPADIRSYALWVGLFLVMVSYLVSAGARKRRVRNR